MLIIRRSKLHYTASGIIKPISGRLVHETATYRCDDDEIKLIVKQILCINLVKY